MFGTTVAPFFTGKNGVGTEGNEENGECDGNPAHDFAVLQEADAEHARRPPEGVRTRSDSDGYAELGGAVLKAYNRVLMCDWKLLFTKSKTFWKLLSEIPEHRSSTTCAAVLQDHSATAFVCAR